MNARYLVQLPTPEQHRREVDERVRVLAAAEQCRKKRRVK